MQYNFQPIWDKAIRIRMNTIDICSDFDIMAICFGTIIVCILKAMCATKLTSTIAKGNDYYNNYKVP